MTRHSCKTALLLLVASLLRADRADQTTVPSLKGLTLEQLGNVEVTTVTKEPEKVSHTAAAIYVLTSDDIRRSGATNIPDVLRLVPGVEVARIDSNTWSVSIRGFGTTFSKSVLVLIDGRSVYTPLFAGVNWKLQNVALEDVDRIEVIRGPGGTIWGANAVNGVINIITKNSSDSQGALISLGIGNVDQGVGQFRYGGGIGKNITYRVYGMAFARGTEFHPDHDNFDDWQLGQGGFRVDWDNQSRDTLTVQGDLYEGRTGERETIAYYSPAVSIDVDGVQNVSGGNIMGRWRHKLSGQSDIQVQAYYDRTDRLGSQLGEKRNTFDLDFIHHLAMPARQDIIWGLGARWSPSDFIQVVPTANFEPHHQSDNRYSAFLQDQVAVVEDRLWVTLGSKFEHNIYTGWEVQPSARLLYTPTSRQTLWAAVTRSVRTPSRLDEDLQLTSLITTNPVPIFSRLYGNPNFVSETQLGYEAGYRSLLSDNASIDIAGFFSHYDHLASLEGSLSTFFSEASPPPLHLVLPIVFGNNTTGRLAGFEIGPDWKPTYWWRLRGSYAYLQMELKTKPGSFDISLSPGLAPRSPEHQGVVQSLFDLPHKMELSVAYRYVSALPAERVGSYGTVDATLRWRPVRDIDFSLAGQNLVQAHHVEYGGLPGPLIGIKRDIFASVTWTK